MRKPLLVEHIPGSPHYRIRFEGGGELPAMLDGAFTSPTDAKRAIEVWQSDARDEPVEVKVEVREDVAPKRGRPAKAIGEL